MSLQYTTMSKRAFLRKMKKHIIKEWVRGKYFAAHIGVSEQFVSMVLKETKQPTADILFEVLGKPARLKHKRVTVIEVEV